MIKREFLATLRNRNAYWFMAAAMALLLAALVTFFKAIGRLDMSDPNAMGQVSAVLFLGYAYTLYGTAVLLVSTIASNCICAEKQHDQLDLLRMTFISPLVFLLGKGANILGIYLLVIIVTLPFAGVMFFFIGIDWLQYVQMLALVAMSAFSAAAIGMLCSSYFYRTLPSAMTTLFLVLLVQALFGIGLVVIVDEMDIPSLLSIPDPANFLLITLVPVVALFTLADVGLSHAMFLTSVGFHAFLVLSCSALAYIILNRPTKPMKVSDVKTTDDVAVLQSRRKKFPYYLIDPQRRRPLIGDRQNPILAKERLSSMAGRGTTSIRLLYLMAIVSVVTGCFIAAFTITSEDAQFAVNRFIAFEMILLLCITPTYIATTFSKEHESGNWDMLRMTQLTAGDVVWGKFLGALQGLALPGSALFLGTLPLIECALRFPDMGYALLMGIGLTATAVIYAVAIGLYVAVRRKGSLSALVTCFLVSAVVFLVLPLFFVLPNEIQSSHTRIDVDIFLYLSPLTTQLDAGIEYYDPLQGNVLQMSSLLVVAGLLILWARYECNRLLDPRPFQLRRAQNHHLNVKDPIS